MIPLDQSNGLAERVYQSILNGILDGSLIPGEHLVQEQLAAQLNVSRQPIQQAMALLRADGLVEKVGRRGVAVTVLDVERMQQHYDLRSIIDGYAARRAAERVASSEVDSKDSFVSFQRLLKVPESNEVKPPFGDLVVKDEQFHHLIYEMSGNQIVTASVRPHWRFLRRAMAEVLRQAEPPKVIWEQHAAIADAILSGEADKAETLSLMHTRDASSRLSDVLTSTDTLSVDQRTAS